MNDKTLSIIIKAQDEASRTLAKISDNTQRAAEVTSRSWLKTSAVMGAVAGVISGVTSQAIMGLTSLVGDAVKRVDTMNNFPRIMSNFGVSAQDATVMIKDLDKGVRGLPTTLNDIVQLAEGFVPVTKNVQMATKTALALNNAILAGGAPMQVQSAAMEQFRQALSKGVPDLQDWKSLEMAMPAQLQQVNEKLGIGKGVLKDYANNGLGLYQAMKDGKLSMDDFNRALVALNAQGINGLPNFATQAKNATQGIATGFTNAKTAITRGLADIMQAFGTSNVSGALSTVGRAVEAVMKAAAALIVQLKPAFHWVAEMLGPSLMSLGNTIETRLIPALSRFAPLWKLLAATIGGLVVTAVWTLINVINILASTFSWIEQVIANVAQWFISRWNNIKSVWNQAPSFFRSIGSSISGALSSVTDAIKRPFEAALDAIKKIPGEIVGAFAGLGGKVTRAIGSVGTGAFNNVKSTLGSLNPFKASGGPVSAGQPYIVGEREAELFVPNTSGTILNQGQMRAAGIGGSTFNMYGSINLGSANAVDAFFERLNSQKEMAAYGVGV